MVLNCCAYGCYKKLGDTSNVRHFLRFMRFPKDTKRQKAWIDRIKRVPHDVNPSTMYVCSDHFFDSQFEQSPYLRSRYQYEGRMKIPLKSDAIPNTDPSTMNYKVPPPITEQDETPRSKRRRRQDLNHIDELVAENSRILFGKL